MPDSEMYSCVFFKEWVVLHPVLVVSFISCLKPCVEQNSVYYFISGEILQNCLSLFGLSKIYFPLGLY